MNGDSGEKGNDMCEIRRVISLHDQQADEVPCEADSRDRVMCDRKSVDDLQRGRGRRAREDYNI